MNRMSSPKLIPDSIQPLSRNRHRHALHALGARTHPAVVQGFAPVGEDDLRALSEREYRTMQLAHLLG